MHRVCYYQNALGNASIVWKIGTYYLPIYRVGKKNCNTFQHQLIGERHELETLTSYKESFDKLFDIHVIITFSKTSNSQRHLKKNDLHIFFLFANVLEVPATWMPARLDTLEKAEAHPLGGVR